MSLRSFQKAEIRLLLKPGFGEGHNKAAPDREPQPNFCRWLECAPSQVQVVKYFCHSIEPWRCYRCNLPDLRAVRALRRNVYPRHHKECGENCVQQDARAVGTPSHNLSPSSKGMHLVSGTYEESGASYVICFTLCAAQIVSITTATPLTPL